MSLSDDQDYEKFINAFTVDVAVAEAIGMAVTSGQFNALVACKSDADIKVLLVHLGVVFTPWYLLFVMLSDLLCSEMRDTV